MENNQDNQERKISQLEEILKNQETTLEKDGFYAVAQELYNRRMEDISGLGVDEQFEKIASRTINIITEEKLKELLKKSIETKKPLRIKFGIDPTGADVHLGHAVPMIVANRFQRMGHDLIIIVGDVTAKIGDPSGRSKERPPLSDGQIAENMKTYKDQMSPFFDFKKAELSYNSTWLNKINMPEMLAILTKVPLSMQLQREDFRKRLELGQSLNTAELMYSILMAYDSVAVEADIEIGGVDQLLNMQMCRKVMDIQNLPSEVVITTDLIEGTDGSGEKMSKSKGNYIGLNEDPDEIFGKVMSIPDRLISVYYKAITEISDAEFTILEEKMQKGELNPLHVKKLLAFDIVSVIHDPNSAITAKSNFEAQFSKKSLSEVENLVNVDLNDKNVAEKNVIVILKDVLNFVTSNTNGRKIAQSGGVRLVLEGEKGSETKLSEDEVIKSTLSTLITAHFPGTLEDKNVQLFIKVGRKAARLII